MKRFHFRLDRVLKLRQYKERQQEIELARVTGECVRIRNRMAEIATDRRGAFMQRASVLDLNLEYAKSAYIARLDSQRSKLQTELERWEQERRTVQQRYLDASRERKVIDKLREREESRYYQSERRAEAKELDDIANTRGVAHGDL
jgi:flagellar FliJ protein